MCIANLTDYDDATAREIWQHEFALQERERMQRQRAELSRLLRIVPFTPEPAERGVIPSPFEHSAPAGDGDHIEVTA